jgi:hypothetical protein
MEKGMSKKAPGPMEMVIAGSEATWRSRGRSADVPPIAAIKTKARTGLPFRDLPELRQADPSRVML